MEFTVLIPARMASTRLPGKPLADIAGVPMVVRVAKKAMLSKASRVVVAADCDEIMRVCKCFHIESLLTYPGHASGSDRLAEACQLLDLTDETVVVNVQGDEPLIAPELIDAVARELIERPDCAMATAACPIELNSADFLNPNVVKVVLDSRQKALYFSRAAIPFQRMSSATQAISKPNFGSGLLRHLGIYSYRSKFIQAFSALPPSPIELVESLEQLRALWHGYGIAVHIADGDVGLSVDTPDDLEKVRLLVLP